MYNQQFEEYRATLAEVVEKYIAHNSQVYVYATKRVQDENDPYVMVTKWTLLWKGMDWQIVYSEDELNYMNDEQITELCPYVNYFVTQICPVLYQDRQFPDSVDEIGLVVDLDEPVKQLSNDEICPICGNRMDNSDNSTQMCWSCTQEAKALGASYEELGL